MAFTRDYILYGNKKNVQEFLKLNKNVKLKENLGNNFYLVSSEDKINLSNSNKKNLKIFRNDEVKSILPDEINSLSKNLSKKLNIPEKNVNLNITGIDKLHREGITGKDVVIAILDSGVYDHEDLSGRITLFSDETGSNENNPHDRSGHGTHVATIAAGKGKFMGVAPDAEVWAFKVLNDDGKGSISNVIKAINKIVEKAKRMDKKVVVNMSLGGPATKPWDQDPLCIAIHNAIKQGVYFVVAAGNSGPKEGTVATPGITPDVITVASYDDKKTGDLKDDDIALSSSRGPVLNAPDENSKIKPDIAVSGVKIWAANSPGSRIDKQADLGLVPRTSDKKYVALSGTSMAAPAISGVVALILQANPSLKPHEVKKIIIENGIPLNKKDLTDGKPYDKYDQGAGLINAYEAVKKAAKIMSTKKY